MRLLIKGGSYSRAAFIKLLNGGQKISAVSNNYYTGII